MKSVVIAGIGCISSLGADFAGCMDSLFGSHHGPSPPTRFPAHCETHHPVFEVPDRYLPDGLKEGTLTRTCRMALAATDEALSHAGVEGQALSGRSVGVCLGTNIGVTSSYGSVQTETNAFLLPRDRFLATNPTHRVAVSLDLGGPQQTVANACTAGADAIGVAAGWIDQGVCEAVIAGGADELTPRVYFGFKSLFINDERPCLPFDKHRRGLNLGEGAGVFLLASKAFCQSLGIVPKGYVLGYGASSDADHFTQPRPDGKGLHLAIDEALNGAGLSAGAVAFVNAHGTGTPDNDRVESLVLAERFAGRPFVSTKGYTGHTLGAAGPIEAALTLGCLERGCLPATAGFETPDPDLPVNPVDRPTTVRGEVALSQNLAFGGNNAVLVIASQRWLP